MPGWPARSWRATPSSAWRSAAPGAELAAGGPLTGQFDLFDATDTDYLLLVEPSGAALVETAAVGDIAAVDCIDPGTRLAAVQADGAPVACWAPAEVVPLRLRGLALASAVLVGISQAVTELSVEHAKNRVQFGRPIGVNQAIKHACVDMAVSTEAALEQTLFGAISLRSGRADAEFQVLAAKVVERPGGHRQRGALHPGARRHGLHRRAQRAPVPQAGARARPLLRRSRRAYPPCSPPNRLSDGIANK